MNSHFPRDEHANHYTTDAVSVSRRINVMHKVQDQDSKFFTTTLTHLKIRRNRSKIHISNTRMYELSLSSLGTDTSKKICRVNLIYWAEASPLSEVMQSSKWFPLLSKMPTLTYSWGNSGMVPTVWYF
jgi:hypothetical protein